MNWPRLLRALRIRPPARLIERHLRRGSTHTIELPHGSQLVVSTAGVEIEKKQRLPLDLDGVENLLLRARYPRVTGARPYGAPCEQDPDAPPAYYAAPVSSVSHEVADTLAAHLRLTRRGEP